ncbi:MAG: hypothetical protein O9292_16070 [Rhodobacteraceae bacterium]|jgi:hypothetical protein|nr:hypothetical protein [Paracoccaceae bacterium]
MGGLKTVFRATALLCALAAPLAARADADLPDDPLRFFASCAGRMSALMEHQWIVDGPASDATKARRADILDLVAALTPPGHEAQVMGWRVEAKAAHAALLAQARRGDPAATARAIRHATALQDQCTAFLS